jgi:hypothetical protein
MGVSPVTTHSAQIVSALARTGRGILALGVSFALAAAPAGAVSTPTSSATACAAAVYHQFDFWIGDWEVTDTGGAQTVALARIEPILNGCVLRENYRPVHGQAGQSLTIYDRSRKLWHQTWVTGTGTLLQIEGKLDNDAMIMSGTNQAGALVRGVWKPVDGAVREIATLSTDGGKSWKSWFDITFRRPIKAHPESPSRVPCGAGE